MHIQDTSELEQSKGSTQDIKDRLRRLQRPLLNVQPTQDPKTDSVNEYKNPWDIAGREKHDETKDELESDR